MAEEYEVAPADMAVRCVSCHVESSHAKGHHRGLCYECNEAGR